MPTTFVAQATDAKTLRDRLDRMIREDRILSEGGPNEGTFRRSAEDLSGLDRPFISGRYLVHGACIRFVSDADIEVTDVFDRLARAGLHLISYQ